MSIIRPYTPQASPSPCSLEKLSPKRHLEVMLFWALAACIPYLAPTVNSAFPSEQWVSVGWLYCTLVNRLKSGSVTIYIRRQFNRLLLKYIKAGSYQINSMGYYFVARKGTHAPGPESGLLSNTWKWILPSRHMCWERKRLYWKGVPGWRAGGLGNPRGLLCHMAGSLRFYGDKMSFQVVSGQSLWLRVHPGGARIAPPRWIPERRILGGW